MSQPNKSPTCNHCEYELDEEETWHGEYTVGKVHTGDCDTSEIKCPSCNEIFYVACVHEVKFTTTDQDGEAI